MTYLKANFLLWVITELPVQIHEAVSEMLFRVAAVEKRLISFLVKILKAVHGLFYGHLME